MNLKVTYSINGFIGPRTDVVAVPEEYATEDVRIAIKALLDEVGADVNRHMTLRNIMFVTPVCR